MTVMMLFLSLLYFPHSAKDRVLNDYMDSIEAQVKLPPGAAKFDRYARYYAFDDRRNVIGVYIIPAKPVGPDEQCEELTADFKSVPCKTGWREKSNAALAGQVEANQRRWVDSPTSLPLVSDGGCSVITVTYAPETRKIISTACNGVG